MLPQLPTSSSLAAASWAPARPITWPPRASRMSSCSRSTSFWARRPPASAPAASATSSAPRSTSASRRSACPCSNGSRRRPGRASTCAGPATFSCWTTRTTSRCSGRTWRCRTRSACPRASFRPTRSRTRVPLLNLEGVLGRRVARGRRPGRPERRGPGLCGGGPPAGREDLHGDRGHRDSVEGGRVTGVSHAAGRHQHAGGRECRRPVGGQGRRAGRARLAHRPAAPADRRHRAAEGRARRLSLRARLQPLALFPPGGQGHPDRPVEQQARSRASTSRSTTPGPSSTWRTRCGASRCWPRRACCANGRACTRSRPTRTRSSTRVARSAGLHHRRRLQRARLHARPRRRPAGGRARARTAQAHTLDMHQLRFSRFAEGDLVTEHNVV